MVLWRTVAAAAMVVVLGFVVGSANGLLGVVDDTAAVVSLGFLAITVIASVALTARSHRLVTAYW